MIGAGEGSLVAVVTGRGMVLRDRARLVTGSIGVGIVLWGLFLFLGQMYRALDSGRLETVPVRLLFDAPPVRHALPWGWLERLTSPLELGDYVDWFLDAVPLSLFLIVVGAVVVWRSTLWESWGPRDR